MYFTVHEPKITGQKTFSGQVGYLAAALWCWYSVNWLLERFGAGFAQSKLFSELTMCSYGIYVFHNMIEPIMISRTAQQLLPLEQWAADHIILFPLVFSLLALLFSYIVTRIFLMTRIGKFLVG